MSSQLVATIDTTYDPESLIKGFIQGWQIQFGSLPNKKSIAVLWAQTTIELGATIIMSNNNLINTPFDSTADANFNYHSENGSFFLAFDSLADGISYYLNFLMTVQYKNAWSAVLSGDPVQFAALLSTEANYSSENSYTSTLVAIFNDFMRKTVFENAVNEIP
jgi:hypothetical protein